MNMLKKIFLSLSFAVVFMLSTTTVFATELDSRQVEPVKPQETETPDSTQEAILELQNGNYEAGVYYLPQAYANGPIDIAGYVDADFTNRSAPEPFELQIPCDTISVVATCMEEGETDTIVLHFVDETYGGDYAFSLPFVADGSVTTIAWSLPAIQGEIYFTCSTHIKRATAIFSKF